AVRSDPLRQQPRWCDECGRGAPGLHPAGAPARRRQAGAGMTSSMPVAPEGRAAASQVHQLHASEETVSVGVIDPTLPPALTIDPGDEVVLSTWGHWGGGVTPHTQMADFPGLKAAFPEALGPHSITGPIDVVGAQPGDSLVVDVLELVPATHGFNLVVAQPRGRGVLRERFPDGAIRHFALDPTAMTTT